MIVVANTTPLILLAKRGLFSLLQRFYGQLLLPPAVWREVVEEGDGRAGQQETVDAQTIGWITVRDLRDREMAQRLRDTFGLGDGESEVIALVQECAADLVLLDDDRAVKRARELGFVVRRTPGILVLAKEQGLIVSVKEHLAALRAEGLWLTLRLMTASSEISGKSHKAKVLPHNDGVSSLTLAVWAMPGRRTEEPAQQLAIA